MKKETKIQVKHITIVINLKNTKAFDYLLFKENLDKLLATYSVSKVQFDLLNKQFAVVYVSPSAIEKTITTEILNYMKDVKLDCVIIDELFPENNGYFIENKSFPQTAKWINSKQFTSKQSYIEVI